MFVVDVLQTQIVHLEDAYGLLDSAVAAAIRNSKPVYISICCNLAGEVHPSFAGKPFETPPPSPPFYPPYAGFDTLHACVDSMTCKSMFVLQP